MRTALALLILMGGAAPLASQPRDSIFAPAGGCSGLSCGKRSLSPPAPRLTTGPLTDSLRNQPLDMKRDPLGPEGEIRPPMSSEPYVLPSQKRREDR